MARDEFAGVSVRSPGERREERSTAVNGSQSQFTAVFAIKKKTTDGNKHGRFNQVCFKQHPGGLSSLYVTPRLRSLRVALRNRDTKEAKFRRKKTASSTLTSIFIYRPLRAASLLAPAASRAEGSRREDGR